MKTISDILRNDPVWVNPNHAIEAAIILMRGLNMGGLPVMESDEIVGIVTERLLMGVDKRKRVDDVMERAVTTLPLTTSIKAAAQIMMGEKRSYMPVTREDGTLAGLLSESDLLAVMRRPIDPITELHWSDTLREWAIEQLQAGQEMTILFIDIDDFGMFNKRHGHIIGDTVLKSVADVLNGLVDTTREIACRYGGDEFCIATLRTAIEATAMAEIVEQHVAKISLADIPDLSVTVTVGQRGGKRNREREHTHYVATLNNLINLASRDCILKKANRRSVEVASLEANTINVPPPNPHETAIETKEQETAPAEDHFSESAFSERILSASLKAYLDGLRLASLGVTRSSGIAHVYVALERGRHNTGNLPKLTQNSLLIENFSGEASGQEEEDSLSKVVAEATAEALRQALPFGYNIRLDEVLIAQTTDGRRLITVAGIFVTPTDTRPIAGSVFSGADPNRAVAAAVLSAANRQLARLPYPSILVGK